MMEAAALMIPIPAVLDKYQGTDYLPWQFDKKARDARHVDWLASLDAMDAKPVQHEQPPTQLDLTPRCHCCTSTPYCRLFGNQEQWLLDSFGCGHAKYMFHYFQAEPEHPEPFFRMLIRLPMQLRPLKLKDKALESKMLSFMERCQQLKKQLGKKLDAKDTPASAQFNRIREVL